MFKSNHRHLLVLLAVMLLNNGCQQKPANNAPTGAMPAISVKIAQPVQQQTTEWDEFTGRIEAINSVEVRAKSGGYLDQVLFKAGAKVKQGEVLFQIDPKPFKAQLNFAEAELMRAQTRRDLAKNDQQRAANLFKEKAISAEELDARSKGLQEAAAAVESAAAQVYAAKLNLEYCSIRAPISGRISRELITAGNLVNGGDTTVLASIVSTDPVYVYADVDEQSLLKYRRYAIQNGHAADLRGLPAELEVSDENGFPHRGVIDYVSPRADSGTGTISIRAVFANPGELLSPGFFARLRLQASAPYPAILIPERAIANDQSQQFVWIKNADNTVVYRAITVGAKINQMRVVKQGLQVDDWLVIDGVQKLKPGSSINPEIISLTP